jgi:hypothetical protein
MPATEHTPCRTRTREKPRFARQPTVSGPPRFRLEALILDRFQPLGRIGSFGDTDRKDPSEETYGDSTRSASAGPDREAGTPPTDRCQSVRAPSTGAPYSSSLR